MSLSKVVNAFSLDLFKNFSTQNVDENIVLSPFSILTCLGMCLSGSREETQNQMFKGMRCHKGFEDINEVGNAFDDVRMIFF